MNQASFDEWAAIVHSDQFSHAMRAFNKEHISDSDAQQLYPFHIQQKFLGSDGRMHVTEETVMMNADGTLPRPKKYRHVRSRYDIALDKPGRPEEIEEI